MHMLANFNGTGEGGRRPINVVPRKNGSGYYIIDGNSTFAVACENGWPTIFAELKV